VFQRHVPAQLRHIDVQPVGGLLQRDLPKRVLRTLQ